MESSKIKFLVKYLNHAKKVENPNEVSIRKIFGIDSNKNIFVQYFDKDFNAYIDTSWSDLLEVESRQLLICDELEDRPISQHNAELSKNDNKQSSNSVLDNKAPVSQCINILSDSIDLSKGITVSVTPKKICVDTEEKDPLSIITENPKIIVPPPVIIDMGQDDSSIEILDSKPYVSPMSSNLDTGTSKNKEYVKCIYPTSYVLSFINPASKLGIALKNKQSIDKKGLKGEFLQKIYESYSSNKKFYVDEGYEEIVNAILNAYPYLSEGLSILSYQATKHYWTKSLKIKFCNERKRTDSTEEAVQIKKKSCKGSENAMEKIDTCTSDSIMWGVPNYYSCKYLDKEDSSAIESHKKWLKTEMMEANKNLSGISLRMRITFNDRRSLLFSSDNLHPTSNAVSDILKEYPCLSLEVQALSEIELLFASNEKFQKYEKCISAFSQQIQELVCASKSKFKTYMDKLFCFGNSLTHVDYLLYRLIGNISLLVGEDPKGIIGHDLNESHGPMLHIEKGGVTLNVDAVPFITNISATNSSFLWAGSFYLFNIQAVSNLKTFAVLQYIFFNIPELKITKLPQCSVKLIQMYNKISNDN